jgi:hypothetical protein
MCFSPQADVIGGLLVSGIGITVVRNVRERHDHLAFAALPLLLGLHQLTESLVWFGLQGHIPLGIAHVATWVYLLFAFVVLPTYVPLAIRALEPPGRRRDIMSAFVAAGAVVSIWLLVAMLRGPVTAKLGSHHIAYHIHLHAGLVIVSVYVLATCASAIFSGYHHIAIFGTVNLIAVAILARLTIDGFASLWCAWAALTSIAIAIHIRYGRPHRSVAAALA